MTLAQFKWFLHEASRCNTLNQWIMTPYSEQQSAFPVELRQLHLSPHDNHACAVHQYAPEFERRWTRFVRPAGSSWRVDETYVKIWGKWVYLYRAVDRDGGTVDFRPTARRDVGVANMYFRKAIESQGSAPRTIIVDGYATSHRAAREMKADGQLLVDKKVQSSKSPHPRRNTIDRSSGSYRPGRPTREYRKLLSRLFAECNKCPKLTISPVAFYSG